VTKPNTENCKNCSSTFAVCVSADRVADKLVAAAREKLTSASRDRDRQLQEQRKQKAAAFLTRMKQSDVSQTAEDVPPELPTECASNSGTV